MGFKGIGHDPIRKQVYLCIDVVDLLVSHHWSTDFEVISMARSQERGTKQMVPVVVFATAFSWMSRRCRCHDLHYMAA